MGWEWGWCSLFVDSCHGTAIVTSSDCAIVTSSDCTIVTSGHRGSTRTTFSYSITQKKLATGSIHDYRFCYCPLVCILFEVLRIVVTNIVTSQKKKYIVTRRTINT